MPVVIVLGIQWGDEGKGKIVDLLSEKADAIVRAQGGHNAGHTVVAGSREFKLHLIPCGILHAHTHCFIGSGVVVDTETFCREIDELSQAGIEASGRLELSEAAHLILPYHKALDRCQEIAKGKKSLGTTLSGIGPCYADKINRIGIRVGELRDLSVFRERLEENVRYHNAVIEKVYGQPPLDAEGIFQDLLPYAEKMLPYVCSREDWSLYDRMREGKTVLLEGAQGVFLDIGSGTYPYVTSSSTIAGGICAGAEVGPGRIDHILGAVKAYTTRVGEGPMPTRFDGVEGFPEQVEARELGTTTGRVRNMGWLDMVMVREAVETNGVTALALTKLDILDFVPVIRVCIGYRIDGRTYRRMPRDLSLLDRAVPIYEETEGWMTRTSGITAYGELPEKAKAYIEKIEKVSGCPVVLVSVGAAREQTIWKNEPYRL